MTDLTEQWKKGELPVGEYYLLYKDGTTDREYYDWANVYGRVTEKGFSTDQNDIKEVLAEVPDYVEWRNMVNCACEEHEANKRLIEENAQLKEQLKECKPYVNGRLIETREHLNKPYTATDKVLHRKAEKLLTKIDEALR